MKSIVQVIRDLVFVPRCFGCGERLDPAAEPLCEECLAAYRLEVARPCPFCGGTGCACAGEGSVLGKVPHIKLFRYYPHEGKIVTNRMIYLLKHRAPRPLVDLLSDALAERIRPHLTGEAASRLDAVCYGIEQV